MIFTLASGLLNEKKIHPMRTFIGLVLWFMLLVICWPLAVIMIFLFPLVWLLLLPLRIVGFTLDVVFSLIKGILLFPFRLIKAI